ncbi:MAG: acyltransferase [Lachnospiraceae bacterium]|nr:acyltransferase [Lachnospiraceae bacterium]
MSETGFDYRKNALDVIKYWAAFCVMYLHYTGYARSHVSGAGSVFMSMLRSVVNFFPPVVIFITVSGFLVSASYERTGSRRDFFRKRFLRLFPPLWICTAVNLAVVTFICGIRPDRSVIPWLVTQLVGFANTPAYLKSFATGSVNGALWTVFVLLQLYVLLAFVYPYLKKLNIRGWLVILGTGAAVNILCYAVQLALPEGHAVLRLLERSLFPYAVWFLTGSFLYMKRDTVQVKLLRSPAAAAGIVILMIVMRIFTLPDPGYYAGIITASLCSAASIAAGYLLPPVRIRPDITYEMFLYHWIVLNVIVHFELMDRLHWALCFILYTLVTLAVSFAAWRFDTAVQERLKRSVIKNR